MRGIESGPSKGRLTNEFGILDKDRPEGYYPGMSISDADAPTTACNLKDGQHHPFNRACRCEWTVGPPGALPEGIMNIPDAEVRKVLLPPGQRATIALMRDLGPRVRVRTERLPWETYHTYLLNLGAESEVVEWLFGGLPDLRTRLLYATLEPWGA